MAKLLRRSSNEVLLGDLQIAKSTFARMKGLLGTSALNESQGLWIHRCNSIHTFFMKYPIDCVFLDRQMVVRSVIADVAPGRMVWPQWRAVSVVEMRAGRAKELGLKLGDELNVGA